MPANPLSDGRWVRGNSEQQALAFVMFDESDDPEVGQHP
jgi:hypothetical protein